MSQNNTQNGKLIKIAIDGPAGAGKSTVAHLVAQKLGYIYLDTGAMYRAITLAVLQAKINVDNEQAIAALVKNCNIEIKNDAKGANQIFLDSKNMTKEIREQAVNDAVSDVSNILAVRKMLVEKQRQIASAGGVVLDGRDIGTVVLPDAELKIYLIASLAVRAQRRYAELKQSKGTMSLADLTEAIDRRDKKDANNTYGPMRAAKDAITVDTDHLHINDVVKKIVELAQDKIKTTVDI
jgi:cytidylate kinase